MDDPYTGDVYCEVPMQDAGEISSVYFPLAFCAVGAYVSASMFMQVSVSLLSVCRPVRQDVPCILSDGSDSFMNSLILF